MIRGVLYMVVASLLFAAMGAFIYQVKIWDSEASALTASFMRVAVNLAFVLVVSFVRYGAADGVRHLFGDMRWSLWARGFFGTLSVMGLFSAIHMIGLGEASFLHAFNAVWIAALSPFVLRQPNTRLGWLAVFMGLVGLYLLYKPSFSGGAELVGRSVAVASGAFAGSAYMMISRAGRSNPPLTVVFYFCLVATIMHGIWFALDGFVWPSDTRSWFMLIAAGLFASVAQLFMTQAYQLAPAALVGAASYTTPVFNLLVGVLFFATIPDKDALIGSTIILFSGVALPFLRERSRKPASGMGIAGVVEK